MDVELKPALFVCMLLFALSGCFGGTKTIVAREGTTIFLTHDAKVTALVPDENSKLIESTLTIPAGSLAKIGQPFASPATPVKK